MRLIKYGKQYVIKSSKYVSNEYLQVEEDIKLGNEEKEKSKEWGTKVKEKMDEELEEVQNKYRRDGKFIDELLKEYNR